MGLTWDEGTRVLRNRSLRQETEQPQALLVQNQICIASLDTSTKPPHKALRERETSEWSTVTATKLVTEVMCPAVSGSCPNFSVARSVKKARSE